MFDAKRRLAEIARGACDERALADRLDREADELRDRFDMSTGDASYNAISYHNGSVWPHDGSLIAFGLGAVRTVAGGAPDRRS